MTHELKTWPESFRAVKHGIKTFEVRKDDRNFQVGDYLILKEYDPEKKTYSGDYIKVRVNYAVTGLGLAKYGHKVDPEIVIMSIAIATDPSFEGETK